MTFFLDTFFFSLGAIAPIFFIIFLGNLLKWRGIIDDAFIRQSSRLVFNIALPLLLFLKVTELPFSELLIAKEVAYFYTAMISAFLLLQIAANIFIKNENDRGVFVQGSFRGNFIIIGLSIVDNLYGEAGLAKAAIVVIFLVPINNILAIITLLIPYDKSKVRNPFQAFGSLLKNPLIIGVLIALPFAYFQWPIPAVVRKTGGYLAGLGLPLALIGIGASVKLGNLKAIPGLAKLAVSIRLVFIPAIFVPLAYLLGFTGQNLVLLFIIFSTPTAVVSFIMADAMNRNAQLAANIVFLSTFLGMFTLATGIFLLRWSGFL